MNPFKKSKFNEEVTSVKAELKEALKRSRMARNMREDICDPELLQKMLDAEKLVRDLRKQKADEKVMRDAIEALNHQSNRVFPPHAFPKWFENTEVLVVALGAAMAIRAYFFQPFKIPTGSMQPTLNGINFEEHIADGTDMPIIKQLKWAITGKSYNVATGMMKLAGDHVIVNKFWYNFVAPKRGDVAVFDTAGINPDERSDIILVEIRNGAGEVLESVEFIQHGDELIDKATARPIQKYADDYAKLHNVAISAVPVSKRQGIMLTYYIKRLVGLPGEKISITDRALTADGVKIVDDFAFDRQLNEYGGYSFAGNLMTESDFIQLENDEFLPFGDNTDNSLDGRYFKGVKVKNLLGPAVCVYWPFGKHWGRIR